LKQTKHCEKVLIESVVKDIVMKVLCNER